MNKPIRMHHVLDPKSNTVYMDVDVYQFFLQPDGSCSALCWFVKTGDWMVVDIEMLVPETTKPQLNE